ncbi:hypothetical protein Ancab_022142 [Ancistrocladus abbreviatus]
MESSFPNTFKLFSMAADEEREHTAEATTINNANAALEEDELELSLGLPVIFHRDCGSNSDAGSHSSHSQPRSSNTHTQSYRSQTEPQPNGFAPNLLHPRVECNSSSCQIESTRTLKKASRSAEGPLSWNDHNHDQTKPPHEPSSSATQVCQDKKPISQPGSPGSQPQKEVHKGDMGKPPKPPAQSSEALLLSQMPCVSATGNGPNGKTVNGFLYRYTKAEVCIICVCHGTSFTPAGFVEHAGGVDIEHPLKRIRVVPFALG